ncbi:MAG: hypothetical protein ACREJX_13860, partial [Polyangiaceae bacterium]
AGGYDYFPSRILASADLLDVTSDAGIDDAGTCKQTTPEVDAGSDAASSDSGIVTSDAGSDASARDAGSHGDASVADGGSTDDAGESPIFEGLGGCSTSGGFAADFSWISILAASWILRRRRRERR